jgi:tripartite-type tricarboxylate transporter receptor subunit TctC
MQEELSGSTFIVKNVPGAGSIIGVNEIYRTKPNGLTFGVINPGLIAAQLVGQRGIKFDLKKMSLLGATGESPYGAIAATPKFKNYEDAQKADPLRVACAGIGTLSYAIPMMAKELKILDNTKIMLGYRGAQAELGMMQGNIDAQWTSWNSVKAFVDDGHAIPIMFVRSKPKEYPNAYNIEDVVKDEKHKNFIGFMETLASKLIRGFAGPPNIPSDRLKTLRQAFKKVTLSPKYEAIMKKAGRPGGYISPGDQKEMVLNSFKVPPEHVEIVKAAYGKKR